MNAKQLINDAIDGYIKRNLLIDFRACEGIYKKIATGAGVSYGSMLNWKDGKTDPKFCDLLAVLNFCGQDLKVINRV